MFESLNESYFKYLDNLIVNFSIKLTLLDSFNP
jgi:hypothetical protein